MEVKSLVELTTKELKEIVCKHFKLDKEKTEIRVSDKLNNWQIK